MLYRGIPLDYTPVKERTSTMLEVLIVIVCLAAVLFLGNLLVTYFFGVPLLCHVGLHRWQKVLVGRGRDARYVVKCKGCEFLKDET
jgi:hypothetical protein